jgi:hypothetical protein
MSNDPQDAYPILSCDELLEGSSIFADLGDLTMYDYAPGDFLLDLWIWAPTKNKIVKAQKMNVDNTDIEARESFVPVKGEIAVDQKIKGGKALLGYNVYYAHESDPFLFLDSTTDTTYMHDEAGLILGLHNYYVTANYEEGESEASNIATEYISGIDEMGSDRIQLYPNPVADMLTIKVDNEIESILLVNSKGQIVLSEKGIKSKNHKINMGNQPAGIFNVRIETSMGWLSHKVIKN